ncbi:MAG TPA: PP2C family protein-serine/threonine phosphatase [Candidatus Acidoferrum sp.]|jgi:serine phosphatase RsbU (regulator of sigma subunit)|nr:PP2C family protein-serine/threonine phosphatase [Candidatus Acidoferrum sp.]
MSLPPVPDFTSAGVGVRVSLADRVRNFWQRVSEGRQIDDLWSQFAADARASYGFYGHDVDWDEIRKLPRWRRPLHVARQFFWALLLKMSPARRVLLLVAFVLLVVSGSQFQYVVVAALLFLLLLALELADKVTMKRDLEIAREIQTWLVPSEAPQVAGADIAFATRPQNSVAGDYYDAFYPNPEERERLMVVIADVAGKSVPAALLMATLQASLRTIAGEDAALADLVARLNRYASAHSLDGRRFTTAVLCEYNPLSRRLTYVNAGHNAPILRRANGGLEILDIGGLPLGIQKDVNYETASLELKPGDALIFFTDGVVEAFNEAGEEFGNDRWLGAIRNLPDWKAQETLQFLMKSVDEFVGATRQSDDITCLVFRSR